MTELTTTHHCTVHSDLFGDYKTTCNPGHVEWFDGEPGILVAYPDIPGGNGFAIVDPEDITIGEEIK